MARTIKPVSRRQFFAIRKALKDTTANDVAAFYGVSVAAVKRVQAAKSWTAYGTKSIEAKAEQVAKANKTARRQAAGKTHRQTLAELKLDVITLQELNKRLADANGRLRDQVSSLEFQLDAARIINKKSTPWYRKLVRAK